MNIKLKLTAVTTILMSMLVMLVLGFMVSISDDIILESGKATLQEVMEDNIDEIEYERGYLDYSDVDFYKDRVNTSIYSVNGEFIIGSFLDTDALNSLKSDEIYKINSNGKDYYVYDKLASFRNGESVYLRSVVSLDEVSQIISNVFRIAFLALPVFIILAGVCCYYISKKAFDPVARITTTAKEINASEDLSLRINLGKGKDEIYELANAFDEMFDSLEDTFEKERQFTSDVSHELRTPVAVILAQCELMLESAKNSEEKEAFEVIQRQGLKSLNLITNLLKLIRIENGIEKPNMTYTDFSELVKMVCNDHKAIAEKGITLESDIEDEIYMELDSDMIIRIVTNLISNGYKYGKNNGFIKVSLKKNNSKIELAVEDNGIGIEEKEQEKIWNRLYQVDAARTAGNNNMGLGLSMVKELAKLHDGKVSVESKLEEGSKFKIIFYI